MEEPPLTHGLFPWGQGREDAGFGTVWGFLSCVWAAQGGDVQQHQPGSQQQHGCVCSLWGMLQPRGCLGTSRMFPNFETAQAQPPRGSAPRWALCMVTAMNQATSGFHWDILGVHQPACKQSSPLCLEEKGGNISIVFKWVWAVH